MPSADFKDHFSTAADAYQRYRPGYPADLFRYLADLSPARELAWDCATGTGQAAQALTEYFTRVIASDASAQQIARAVPAAQVEYVVASAETIQLPDDGVDLITVAQALHWFNQAAFYRSAWRCLKPRGVLAVWNYNLARIEPALDEVINWYYSELLGPYWPPERAQVEQGYAPIPAPFSIVQAPDFAMQADWNRHALLGYLSTWSAGKYYREQTQQDPLAQLLPRLHEAWPEANERKTVRWPLQLQIGIKHDAV